MKRSQLRDRDNLYAAILGLSSLQDARRFFRDLLTEYEISEFAERWKAARMLAEGRPYTEIASETGLSSRTIARVARWLKRGKGGYAIAIRRSRR